MDAVGVSSERELSRHFGYGATTITSKRQRGSVPYAECVHVANETGISLDWLVFGKGDSLATSQPSAAYRVDDGAPLPAAAGPGPGMAAVALYDVEGAAGDGRSLEGERIEGELYFPESQLAALGVSPGQVAGIKVRGDSMEGTLDDGDWVLVDLANRDARRSGVFLLWQSGERRIKRVQRLPGGALQLISDNTHYPPEMIRPEEMREVEILGRCEVRIGRVS